MRIIEGVVDVPPFLAVPNELLVAEDPQLMRNGALLQIKLFTKIVDASLLVENGGDNAHSCGIREGLESRCYRGGILRKARSLLLSIHPIYESMSMYSYMSTRPVLALHCFFDEAVLDSLS